MKRRKKRKSGKAELPRLLRRAGLRLRTPPPRVHTPPTVYRRRRTKREDRRSIEEELES
ncbi:MAG: hypothetical protein ACE5O2_05810 [Armatimonadota bacterium]